MFFKRFPSLTVPKPPASTDQDPQTQSILLNRLPAEIRNEIYALVFATEEWPLIQLAPSDPPLHLPHPLSLLLTCRPSIRKPSCIDVGSLLSNAFLLFPHLSRFTIKSKLRGVPGCGHQNPPRQRGVYTSHAYTNWSEDTQLVLRAIDRYAPPWFVRDIERITDGKVFRWQTGSRWTAKWSQVESGQCYSRKESGEEGPRQELFMDSVAIGVVAGVQKCRFGCNEASWTHVVLLQEGGRHVDVDVVYGEGAEPSPPERKNRRPKFELVPGTMPVSPSEVMVERSAIGYEPVDDEYWEAIRRRNGNLGAVCRGIWKNANAAMRPVAASIPAEGSPPRDDSDS
ncbi:hypothetical protein C7974DRAFT_306385 [Boeremia exigua]|uniref:uncharacterized protein n=1 Tax=Boeremia exigua TaxID=749465 RepID=UPI001E8E679F|nr:uncharacterized protein C7974DRAFT_306385 [Boeremia exigua]KAH6639306.1 hypothetical protein C7974DRAFT_306385 [Boeremia exigua]